MSIQTSALILGCAASAYFCALRWIRYAMFTIKVNGGE